MADRLAYIFGGITALQNYNSETVSISSALVLSQDVYVWHTIPLKYPTNALSLSQSIDDSGSEIETDTTPERSLSDRILLADSVSVGISYTLSHHLTLDDRSGLFYAETLDSELTLSDSVEETFVYEPDSLTLSDAVVADCGASSTQSLDLGQTVAVIFDKTEVFEHEITLSNYGVAILIRDGIEQTYDLRGSDDAYGS